MNLGTSGNPLMSEKSFQKEYTNNSSDVMTQSGAYNKVAILLLLCVSTASYTFTNGMAGLILPGVIGGFVFALITIFKKSWAPITAPIYALLEGLALGGISYAYKEAYAPGIVTNAIMLTFAVLAIMFFMYRYEIIKVTEKFKKIIGISIGAIMLVYLVSFVMSFFGTSIPMIHGAGPIGIGFSVVVVGIASFSLLMDFDFIEKAAASRSMPKYMEWFAAFGLMVTLVWLYLEILRLLSKLQSRR